MQLITTIHSSNYLILNVDNIWQHLTTFDNTAENYKYVDFSCSAMEEKRGPGMKVHWKFGRSKFWQGGCRHLQQYRGKNTVSCHILAQHDETWGRKDGRQCTMRHATGIFLMSRFEISVVLSVWEILQIWLLGFLLLVVASIASSLQLRVSPCRGSLKQVG